ncbi:site-specific integrase [Sinomonas terrae]|uniref:Site-specific integrase n=1 Tax=Sinomonas terrae TaxID=2908838 RepID=A0ABS9TZL7_9MICC|nr:site-specific integrase [Sinomonas terrae]MCH6469850.1 site-specific integrase [Sinomonas terrae]
MLGLGVRIGEALALRWRDVDLNEGLVHVRGTLVDQAAYKLEDGTPISSEFFRQDWRNSGKDKDELILEAPSFVLDVLTRRRLQSPLLNPIEAVFVTRTGTWQRPSNIRRQFRMAKEEAGLRVDPDWATPHKLRTTALTAVANAVDAQAAALLAGHSSPRTTELFYLDPGPVKPVRRAEGRERFAGAAGVSHRAVGVQGAEASFPLL